MNNNGKIKRMVSDVEMERELLDNIQRRSINQKFLYIEGGAKLYYDCVYSTSREKEIYNKMANDFKDFLVKNLDENKKTALIVLGCGNAYSEKPTLEFLEKEWMDFAYFGVDYSETMLEMAVKNLKDLKIKKTFVCVDIISDVFEQEIVKLTKNYEHRIFAFIGDATFNNTNQTVMADKLSDMMKKDDLLWVDIPVRKNIDDESDLELFLNYKKSLTDKLVINKDFFPLKYLGVSSEDTKIFLETNREESVGSLLFTFGFIVLRATKINFAGKQAHLLKGDKINVINIRAYYPEILIKFFEEFEFKLVDKMITMEEELMPMGQLLFRK